MKRSLLISQEVLMSIDENLRLSDAIILELVIFVWAYSFLKKDNIMSIHDEEWLKFRYHIIYEEIPMFENYGRRRVRSCFKRLNDAGLIKTNGEAGNYLLLRPTDLSQNVFFGVHNAQVKSKKMCNNATPAFTVISSKLDNNNNIYNSSSTRVQELDSNKTKSSKDLDSVKETTRYYVSSENAQVKVTPRRTKDEKTEVWLSNIEYIASRKEKFETSKYDFPHDGVYDYRYLINHGKCSPDKFFGALYWKQKESLSKGEFSYKFKTKDIAWSVFSSEQKTASKLASILTAKEFIELMEKVDSESFDDKKNMYRFEWKLSTIIKNLTKI